MAPRGERNRVSTRCFGERKGRKFSAANKRNEQRMVMKHNTVALKEKETPFFKIKGQRRMMLQLQMESLVLTSGVQGSYSTRPITWSYRVCGTCGVFQATSKGKQDDTSCSSRNTNSSGGYHGPPRVLEADVLRDAATSSTCPAVADFPVGQPGPRP
ncbi:unnamed protein product [Urochloa humidicola]